MTNIRDRCADIRELLDHSSQLADLCEEDEGVVSFLDLGLGLELVSRLLNSGNAYFFSVMPGYI